MITLLVGRIFQIALAILQIQLATYLLRPDQYGTWILIQTIIAFFVMFFLSPAGLYINRHVNEWYSQKMIPEVFGSYTLVLLIVSFFSTFIFYLIQKLNVVNLHVGSELVAAVIISSLMFTQTFQQTWVSCLNFIGKRKEFIFAGLTSTGLGLLIVYGFSRLGWSAPESWAVSFGVSFLFGPLIFIPKDWYQFDKKRFEEFKNTIELKKILSYSLPLFFSTLFLWFQTQGYRFIVENKIGLSSLGQFAAGYSVVSGLYAALEVVIISFYQPSFFKNVSDGNEISNELKKVWKISLYPYFLATAFLFVLGPELAKLFLQKNFINSTDWISWVILAEGLRVFFNVVCVNFHATKKTWQIAWPHLLGALLTLGLLLTSRELHYKNLLLCIGVGYFLSILLLLGIEFKVFVKSSFFFHVLTFGAIGLIYFLISSYLASRVEGINKIIVVSVLGFVFILPYYFKNVRSLR